MEVSCRVIWHTQKHRFDQCVVLIAGCQKANLSASMQQYAENLSTQATNRLAQAAGANTAASTTPMCPLVNLGITLILMKYNPCPSVQS